MSDDAGSVTTSVPPARVQARTSLGLVLVEAVLQHEGDVVAGVGKARRRARRRRRAPRAARRARWCRRARRSAGRAAGGPPATPGGGGRRAARPRWRRRRACRATAAIRRAPPARCASSSRKRSASAGPVVGPAVPGRLEQLGGGRERRGGVGLPSGDVAHVLARGASGLVGDDARGARGRPPGRGAGTAGPRPSGPAPRGRRPRRATRGPCA